MNETALTAQVAIENTVYHFDKLFSYLVPPQLAETVRPGVRVAVPFGAGNRKRVGVVFSVAPAPADRLKPIAEVLDHSEPLSEEMLQLAVWMKERYYCTLFEAVKLMIPSGFQLRLTESYVLSTEFKNFDREEYPPMQWQLILLLREAKKAVPMETISAKLGITAQSPDFQSLLEQGVLCKVNTATSRVKDALAKSVRPLPDFHGKLTPRQKDVYEVLCDVGEATEKELCYFTGASPPVVKALAQKGAAEIFEYEVYRRPAVYGSDKPAEAITLSPEQQQALDGLLHDYHSERTAAPHTALLYGVTGSGKTSVFLKLIEAVRSEGKGIIVMVPEIALTGQTIARFQSYFGDSIAVFHSGLSLGERLDEWKRARRGDADIVVGTRSAVFAPVQNLGLIVMDEEQEHTYKSESSPRYDAREVARYRCNQQNAFCLFCSATPSVETMKLAQDGSFGFYQLKNRYGTAQIPQVRLIDMNQESFPGDDSAIGISLGQALIENFQAGHQSIVLLNRRGYHTFAACSSCGEVVTCPNCSISMTYHSANNRLMCHYCGHSIPMQKTCPICGKETVSFRGAGTQRAEEQLSELLPQARILRLDTDSVGARYSLDRKLDEFAKGEYDVMVGTQMVAKGLDFENVTLVGVLSADQSLYSDDFRSNERTFDLLTQVVGRAGRGKYPGIALIQTYSPEHPVLHFSAQQDYFGFYEQESAFRKAMLYPPYVDVLMLGFVGTAERTVSAAAETFLRMLSELAAAEYPKLPLRVLRPSPAAVARVGGKYRYKIIIKCKNVRPLREMVSRLLVQFASLREFSQVTAYADTNPARIL